MAGGGTGEDPTVDPGDESDDPEPNVDPEEEPGEDPEVVYQADVEDTGAGPVFTALDLLRPAAA